VKTWKIVAGVMAAGAVIWAGSTLFSVLGAAASTASDAAVFLLFLCGVALLGCVAAAAVWLTNRLRKKPS
jgi:energy-converting hydrogenase Eha subunit B